MVLDKSAWMKGLLYHSFWEFAIIDLQREYELLPTYLVNLQALQDLIISALEAGGYSSPS